MGNWERFVRWYDLDQGAYEEDISFYLALAQRTGSPILELGCGTGRLVVALAQAGHSVVGVDNLPAMLARAQEKVTAAGPELAGRVQLLPADLRQLALERRFALAILAVNTFMHLSNPQDQARALAGICGHLSPGGLLVLDLFHPHPAVLTPSEGQVLLERVLTDPETGDPVLKFVSQRVDHAEQTITATFIYDHIREGGELLRTTATFPMRFLYRSEAERMLEKAGFVVEGVYASYDLAPYQDEGARMLFLARRPEGEPPPQKAAP
jgi:SAM-dependent methyltransferase